MLGLCQWSSGQCRAMCRVVVCCLLVVVVGAGAQRLELYEGDACKRVAGVDWICKQIKDCAKAQEDLQNGRRPETCGFGSNNEVIVCCQPSRTPSRPRPPPTATKRPTQPTRRPTQPTRRPTQPTRRPTQPTRRPPQPPRPNQRFPEGGGRKSKEMCRKYGQSVFFNTTSEFGSPISYDFCEMVELAPLITNGTKAQPREFPHMALIGYGQENRIRWSCGGSLISERWVLSAAHCTYTGKDGKDSPKWVRLGEYNVRSTKDEEDKVSRTEDFDIVQLINHPQYDPRNEYNDLALYKLNREVIFSMYVRPICLHTEYQIPRKEGLITGWGRIGYSEKQSDILLKGNVTFISGRQCRDSLKTVNNNREIRDESMICAANFETETDTCQGDSGGPLQYVLKDPYCMYSQVGITSFGIRCASSYPAVYTRVSHFVPWIESIVWP